MGGCNRIVRIWYENQDGEVLLVEHKTSSWHEASQMFDGLVRSIAIRVTVSKVNRGTRIPGKGQWFGAEKVEYEYPHPGSFFMPNPAYKRAMERTKDARKVTLPSQGPEPEKVT